MRGKKDIFHNGILCLIVLCMAWGMKHHYSIAKAKNLKWILAPTAGITEIITEHSFHFKTDTGYINQDIEIIIAPACAGINFLIAAFSMSSFCGIFRFSGVQKKYAWLFGCAAGAFITTICVNAFRIWISIETITADIHAGWFTPQRVHRISGILIYFFFLNIFYHIIQKIIYDMQPCNKRNLYPIYISVLPLACYWIIAIGVPLINMAHRKDPAVFAEHSLTVVLISFAILGFFFAARIMKTKISA